MAWRRPADLEKRSVVLRGSGGLVRGPHVVQVATVLVPAVVEGLALEESRRRGQVGDGGNGQVVVGVRRDVLRHVGKVLLGVVVRGRRVELHVGERVSDDGGALRGDGPAARIET